MAAMLLGVIVVAGVEAGHKTLKKQAIAHARSIAGLALADAVARVAANQSGKARDGELLDLQARQPDSVQYAFVAATGGVDEFGISRGAELVFGQVQAGQQSQALLQACRPVQTAGERALSRGGALDADQMLVTFAGDRQAFCVPYVKGPDRRAVAGVAGVVLQLPQAPPTPLWPWLLPLLLALLAPVLAGRLPGRISTGFSVLYAIAGLAVLALLGALPRATTGGVAVLAADALVPHGGLAPLASAPLPWLLFGALALGAVCGLCLPGLAVMVAYLRKDIAPYLYVGPAMLATGVLVFVPFAVGVGLSFVSKDGQFIGFDNYAEVIRTALDPSSSTHFARTLAMTVLWTAINIALHVSFGLGLALVLNAKQLRGRALYRLLLIVPWAVPSYITALTWKWLFNTQYGPINAMLSAVGVAKVDWLGDSVLTNFAANLATNVWLGFPFMMVISLGALQSIPTELYEAADIDGATAWQKFVHVTMPLLRPALFPAIILGTIWTFNAFNVIYLVSGGGPERKTDILITEAYYTFTVLRRTGLAAAYSVLIFLLLLSYTLLTNRKTRATEAVST